VSVGSLSALPLSNQRISFNNAPVNLVSSAGAPSMPKNKIQQRFQQRGLFSERLLPVCVLLSSSSALIPLVVICKCGNTNYHKTINTNADKEHSNNNLRGSPKCWATSTKHRYRLSYYSANGDYSQVSLLSDTLTASTGIQIYSNVY
jgi:hypothetical protein